MAARLFLERYIILLSSVLLLVACGKHTHVADTAVADSLLTEISSARYRSAPLMGSLASSLDSVSHGNNELRSVVMNTKAYSALMAMDYARASQLYKSTIALSECEIEALVADVGMMTLCYRVSENRLFFDYRTSALSRIRRINEDADYLSQGDRQRFNRAKVEFDIVSICYFSNLAMLNEQQHAVEQLKSDIAEVESPELRLYGRMLLANNERDAIERLSLLNTGLNVAENRNIAWLSGNYRLLLAISLRDSIQLNRFVTNFPKETARLLPHGSAVEELPFILAGKAADDFKEYGDRYMMVEAMAVNASCHTQRTRFNEALSLLDTALVEIQSYYSRYYPSMEFMSDNPLSFIDNGEELVSDVAAGVYNIPECLLSVCREASCAYAGIGDKVASDINREAYLELLRTTRMNKELESRASTAEALATSLRMPVAVSFLSLLFVILLIIFVYYRRRSRDKQRAIDRQQLLRACRVLISSIPRSVNTKEELYPLVSAILNREMENFSSETKFTLSLTAVSDSVLPYTANFEVIYSNSDERDILTISSALPLSSEKKSIIGLLLPYIAVAVEEGLRLTSLSDERERVDEQRAAYAIYLAGHKRENLLKRVSLSVVSAVRPFMDRIINELRVLDTSLSPEDRQRKLEYVSELIDKLDDLNVILERWIKTRQGEYNLRVENFALSSLFGIIGKRGGLLANRGVELRVKCGEEVVKADKALTLFMINTLVDNAAKFTPPGGSVTLESIESENYVEIAVTDTGVGISQKDIDRILGEKVYDASHIGEDNPQLPPKSKGGGFGLMNCKGIIEKYRKSDRLFSVCSLDIKSEKGSGSRFSFRLPKGVLRLLLPLFMLLPLNSLAITAEALFERVNECADSVFMSNVNGNYEEAFVQAQEAIRLLNSYYNSNIGGSDTLTLSGGKGAELSWWREELFPDSLREDIFYNILDIRNELAVASLAMQRWDTYRYNNHIYSTLYRLVHEDKNIATHYAGVQHVVNVQYAAIALSCFLLFVLLLYCIISFVRHNIIEYTNERLVLEVNSRLLRLSSGKERSSVEELVQAFVNELYDCMGENMRLKRVAMLLRPGGNKAPVYAACANAPEEELENMLMYSYYDSGQEYLSPCGTKRLLPLYTSADGERTHVGVLEVVSERPLSDGETVSLELVAGYLASTAYHSAVLVTSGYQAIEEMEEEAEQMRFEENRMHVQNMVMDNCLSVIKHETIYYPSRIRDILAKALSNVGECGKDIAAMRELMDYYSAIYGILSNCAVRELDEASVSLTTLELSSLFAHAGDYLKRRAAKQNIALRLNHEPVNLTVRGDEVLLELLFDSLVDAALKHPAEGTITLRAEDTADFVRVEFADSRYTITSEEAAELFTPTRRNLGAANDIKGMEYLVAKEIVRLHEDYSGKYGGRMEARSDVSGTVIIFTLPK